MENKTLNANKEEQFFAHFMKRLVESMLEIPIKGKECIHGNKIAIEAKIEENMNKRLSSIDRDNFNICVNQIISRIQNLSTVGKPSLSSI
jgi:hypothetical protein